MNAEADSAQPLADPRSDTEPVRVAPPRAPETKGLLSLAVAVIVVAALYVARDVLIPMTLAVILSFVLSPLVNLLGRLGLWRGPAVLASVMAALGAIVLVGVLIGSQASALAVDAPAYAETIGSKVEGAQAFAANRMAALTALVPGLRHAERPPVEPASSARSRRAPQANPNTPQLVEIATPQSSPLALVRTVLAPVLGPLETTVIVIVVAIFILVQKEDLRDRFIRLVGSEDLNRTTVAIDDAAQRLSRYFVSQLAVNTAFGVVISLGLWLIGVPSPAVWGVLAGLLRFVPYVGPILGSVPPLALAAAIDPGWSKVAYVAGLFVAVEPLTGYVVEPLLYGHSTGLSPISVIVAAVFWTWIWGPIGLILSTPLTLCLVVVGRHARPLEFFDVLLGDRPALPAVERFYQRILANDPDEVLAQAETVLTERSLAEYYDNIALPGLTLAARDQARGSINAARASEMTRTMLSVIEELGDLSAKDGSGAQDAIPSATSPPAATVACIAGRGRFDDAVAAMLAQLLQRSGLRTKVIPCRAASRDSVGHLDLSGVSVIALSYLELAGSTAHLHYLVARLRQRAAGATVIVGLWPGDGHSVEQQMETIGADRYVGSLREAVEAAHSAATRG